MSLSGNNLFDVVARRHSSLLKDYAPLAGRDIRLSARLGFLDMDAARKVGLPGREPRIRLGSLRAAF